MMTYINRLLLDAYREECYDKMYIEKLEKELSNDDNKYDSLLRLYSVGDRIRKRMAIKLNCTYNELNTFLSVLKNT